MGTPTVEPEAEICKVLVVFRGVCQGFIHSITGKRWNKANLHGRGRVVNVWGWVFDDKDFIFSKLQRTSEMTSDVKSVSGLPKVSGPIVFGRVTIDF
jgi:hypothetical protein